MTETSVTVAVQRLAKGGIILITGDKLRGGDIDLVIAARFADAAAINFLATYARGLICLAIQPDAAMRLGISLLNSSADRQSNRPFGQSIEAREGVTTGISAADRARTVAVAIDPNNSSSDLVSPGHVFPLIVRAGGVAERPGAAEAAVKLCQRAGVGNAAVICAVLREDGQTARAEDIAELLQAHDIPAVSVGDVLSSIAELEE